MEYLRYSWLLGSLITYIVSMLLMPMPSTAHTTVRNRQHVVIVPQLPEAASRDHTDPVFFSNSVVITATASSVLLASSADGQGLLCTDDQATLQIQASTGETVTWSHSYASPNRQRIVCQEPQIIGLPHSAGSYTFTMTLEDIYAPKYGSASYILIFEQSAQTMPAPAQVAKPLPLVKPTTHATAAPTPSVTQARPPELGRLSVQVATTQPKSASERLVIPHWRIASIALCGLAVLLVVLARGRRRTHTPHLYGIADITDQETGERRTFLLGMYAQGAAILRHPLDLIAWPAHEAARAPVATIVPAKQGPVLMPYHAGNAEEAMQLRAGEYLSIDHRLKVRFRG